MSHKNKVCNVALATHIETCFTGFTFTPLIFNGFFDEYPHGSRKKVGLKNVVEADIEQVLSKLKTKPLRSKHVNELAKKFLSKGEESLGELTAEMDKDWSDSILSQITKTIEKTHSTKMEKEKAKLLKSSDVILDLSRPLEALLAREKLVYTKSGLKELIAVEGKHEIAIDSFNYEFKQLGMFFTEETCFRPEGLAYSPCGFEGGLLPEESTEESNKLTEEAFYEVTEGSEVTDYRESTVTAEEGLTLTSSYEKSIKNTIDLKKKTEASVKGKLFKVLDVSLKSTTSLGFNRVMEKISKSSSTFTRSLVSEAVSKLTTKSTYESIKRRTITQEITKNSSISNTTKEPMQYIIRDSYCVNSVIHKRTNAQLAWSDCIENPGKNLCRHDNLEEKLSEEIKAINDKWSNASPPSTMGPKPADEQICTATSTLDDRGRILGDNTELTGTMYGNIPPGSTYIGGSAQIEIINSDTDVVSQQVITQPSNGATGSSHFLVKIMVDNKFLNKEWVTYKICFKVTSSESAEYYANLNQWRNEQAEAEIETLLTESKEKLNEFLLSDKVASAIEKRIFKDFFGLTSIEDCCDLISHIRSIFDFDSLCFSLQPSWDESGTGCQSSDPVSIYTAQCLKFYLPVKEGKEWQAVTTLLAINAIPHTALHQVGAYINAINHLRDTEFNSTFDPAGWNETIDAPNQYNLTPYDTTNDNWDTAFESKLNFQLIDAYTVTVPTGGIKIDLRPVLCEG